MTSRDRGAPPPIKDHERTRRQSKFFSWNKAVEAAFQVEVERRSSEGRPYRGRRRRRSRRRRKRDDGNGDGERRDPKGPVDGAGGPATGLNRTGKSCRLRWVNYLHPGLKRGRITPQEERQILELHSRLGNRWSRIARKLPGRTDNEIKNYWRTHMRKKAQERKRNTLSPSSSTSSLTDNSLSASEPPSVAGLEQHELNSAGGCCCVGAGFVENEEGVKGYPMDQIWNEIATPEAVSGLSFEDCKNEVFDTSWPPVPSPLWEYGSESLWKLFMDDEEFKMFPSVDDLLISNYQHGREFFN